MFGIDFLSFFKKGSLNRFSRKERKKKSCLEEGKISSSDDFPLAEREGGGGLKFSKKNFQS